MRRESVVRSRCHYQMGRTAKHLFLGAEHRGLQFINNVKNEPKILYLRLSIFNHFPLIKSY